MRKNIIVKVATLVFSSAFIKILGFVFRIYLSKMSGAEGCGLYQLVLSVYVFFAGITSFGISQTLSKLISYNEKHSKKILRTALKLTGAVSFLVFLTVYLNAEYISLYILKDSRLIISIRLIAFCYPAIAVFSSVGGYFNGLTKVKYPANGQIIEQITRIVFVFLFAKNALSEGLERGIFVMSAGIVLGEYMSMLYIFISYKFYSLNKHDAYTKKSFFGSIIKISIPVATGGYISSFLHTMESVLLPNNLAKFGMTVSESVSTLGLIKGMAAPIVFLPAVTISAISTLTLPKISKEDSKGHIKTIKSVTTKTLIVSFFVGLFSAVFFALFGEKLTFILYGNSDSAVYVKLLGIVLPFAFFNMTAVSVLNGMGYYVKTVMAVTVSGLIKILFIGVFVAKIGIKGYFEGYIISEITAFLMLFKLIFDAIYSKK